MRWVALLAPFSASKTGQIPLVPSIPPPLWRSCAAAPRERRHACAAAQSASPALPRRAQLGPFEKYSNQSGSQRRSSSKGLVLLHSVPFRLSGSGRVVELLIVWCGVNPNRLKVKTKSRASPRPGMSRVTCWLIPQWVVGTWTLQTRPSRVL